MIQTPGYLSSASQIPVGLRSHYLASATHYEVVARRIVAALRDRGRPMVLLTSDPPADPEVLSQALGNVAGPGYAVVIISCGPEFKRGDLERAVPTRATPKAGGVAAEPGCSVIASPLFVFDDFDRLSDRQIEDVYEGTHRRDQIERAAVLLAPLDFHDRLERPALQFLKQSIAAQFRFQEVGDDEAIAVLHDQLIAQRDRRIEARGFRRGVLIGSAAGGVAIVASIGVFMLHSTTEQVYQAPASIGRRGSVSSEAPVLAPASSNVMERAPAKAETVLALPAAPPPPPAPALTTAPPSSLTAAPPSPPSPPLPPTKVENPPPTATPPGPVNPPAGPRLSAAEISALVARGDAFLATGDITSARSFFERAYDDAADADSGLAALQLGATFDPIVLDRAGIRGVTSDPVQALAWYRRARELGMAEAEQRIKDLQIRPPGQTDIRRR